MSVGEKLFRWLYSYVILLLKLLDRIFEKGFYKSFLHLLNRSTFNRCLNDAISDCLNRSVKDKLRPKTPWVSEIYQVIFLSAGLISYLCIKQVASNVIWSSAVCLITWYRIYEIDVFTVNWIISDEEPLYSYGRSLVCYIVNLFEVALYVSLQGMAIKFGLSDSFGRFEYFYKHLEGMITFNGFDMDMDGGLYFYVLSGVEFFTSALLISVIITGLVGRLSRPIAK